MAEKKIDGVVYRFDKLPATASLPLLLRLLKVVGPAKDIFFAIAENDETKKDEAAFAAAMSMLSGLDVDEVTKLVTEIVQHCRADGEPAVFGVKPQYLPEALKVLMFALQTEFGDFFGDGLELAGIRIQPKKPGPVSAPKK